MLQANQTRRHTAGCVTDLSQARHTFRAGNNSCPLQLKPSFSPAQEQKTTRGYLCIQLALLGCTSTCPVLVRTCPKSFSPHCNAVCDETRCTWVDEVGGVACRQLRPANTRPSGMSYMFHCGNFCTTSTSSCRRHAYFRGQGHVCLPVVFVSMEARALDCTLLLCSMIRVYLNLIVCFVASNLHGPTLATVHRSPCFSIL